MAELTISADESWSTDLVAGPRELALHYICPSCRRPYQINLQPLPWHAPGGHERSAVQTQLWCHFCQIGTAADITG